MPTTSPSFPNFAPLPATRGRVLVVSLFLPNTISVDVPNPKAASAKSTTSKSARAANTPTATSPNGDPMYWHITPSGSGNIGLQNAVNTVVHRMTRRLWVGTLGISTEGFSEEMKYRVQEKMLGEADSVAVFVTNEEMEGHYNHFCKQVLWRSFHYQLSDYPKSKAFEERAWKQYVSVNQKFADVIAAIHQPGDVIWVNDYHLMLVPAMVRQLIPTAMIGFFLHIPFPSSEIFRCLHVRKQILEGMLGADLIGFQTYAFMRHFLMTCTRLLSLESTPKGIQLDNTVVSVGIFPIGINLLSLHEKRNNPDVNEIITSLKERYAGKALIIGRDKNDAIKGVRQKMLAFERFLTKHPEWLGRVVLIQVALSTAQENESEANVDEVVARINSKFGTIEYTPVVYLHQDISFSHYLALLTIADACLITSLRDGMNLTSHEYVACQEVKKSPLIISEFAGTYGSFGDALRVNPWDTQEVADAIYEALTMSEEDKLARWNQLHTYITTTNTAQVWVDTFVNEIVKVHESLQTSIASMIPPLPFTMVQHEYATSSKRILFLDHDGTLVPVGSPLANNIYEVLVKLSSDPKNIVYLMSGRMKDELEVFRGIPNIGVCAENGCFVQYAGKNKWEPMLPGVDLTWKKQVLDIFEYYTDRTPGSYIEQKECSVVWHFGLADLNFVSWQAAECQNHIEQALSPTYPIHALAKRKRVEVMPTNANKGILVHKILDFHQRPNKSRSHEYQHEMSNVIKKEEFDFILAAGDDRADERMFEYLAKLGTASGVPHEGPEEYSEIEGDISGFESVETSPGTDKRRIVITCTVGRKSSAAYWHVTNISEITNLIDSLIDIGYEDGVRVKGLKLKGKNEPMTPITPGSVWFKNNYDENLPPLPTSNIQSVEDQTHQDGETSLANSSSSNTYNPPTGPTTDLQPNQETKEIFLGEGVEVERKESRGKLSRRISLFRADKNKDTKDKTNKLSLKTATLMQWMFVRKNN